MKTEFCVVLCTCPEKAVAEKIAAMAVSQQLAACVNVIDGMQSVYQWQGEIQQDNEVQLILKTRYQQVDALYQQVLALHPYDVPEWLVLDVASGSQGYLAWIRDSVKIESSN